MQQQTGAEFQKDKKPGDVGESGEKNVGTLGRVAFEMFQDDGNEGGKKSRKHHG